MLPSPWLLLQTFLVSQNSSLIEKGMQFCVSQPSIITLITFTVIFTNKQHTSGSVSDEPPRMKLTVVILTTTLIHEYCRMYCFNQASIPGLCLQSTQCSNGQKINKRLLIDH